MKSDLYVFKKFTCIEQNEWIFVNILKYSPIFVKQFWISRKLDISFPNQSKSKNQISVNYEENHLKIMVLSVPTPTLTLMSILFYRVASKQNLKLAANFWSPNSLNELQRFWICLSSMVTRGETVVGVA